MLRRKFCQKLWYLFLTITLLSGTTFAQGLGRLPGVIFANDRGERNSLTISNILTLVGTSERTLVLDGGDWAITNSMTIPTNINLTVLNGSALSIATNKVLTVRGGFTAGDYLVFKGPGTVAGPATYLYRHPEWGSTSRYNLGTAHLPGTNWQDFAWLFDGLSILYTNGHFTVPFSTNHFEVTNRQVYIRTGSGGIADNSTILTGLRAGTTNEAGNLVSNTYLYVNVTGMVDGVTITTNALGQLQATNSAGTNWQSIGTGWFVAPLTGTDQVQPVGVTNCVRFTNTVSSVMGVVVSNGGFRMPVAGAYLVSVSLMLANPSDATGYSQVWLAAATVGTARVAMLCKETNGSSDELADGTAVITGHQDNVFYVLSLRGASGQYTNATPLQSYLTGHYLGPVP